MANALQSFTSFLTRVKDELSEGTERSQRTLAIAGSIIMGPAILEAYKATAQSNQLQAAREAATAAGAEIAQQPYLTSQTIGGTGEISLSKGITAWLPLGLAFIVVMYIIFKD